MGHFVENVFICRFDQFSMPSFTYCHYFMWDCSHASHSSSGFTLDIILEPLQSLFKASEFHIQQKSEINFCSVSFLDVPYCISFDCRHNTANNRACGVSNQNCVLDASNLRFLFSTVQFWFQAILLHKLYISNEADSSKNCFWLRFLDLSFASFHLYPLSPSNAIIFILQVFLGLLLFLLHWELVVSICRVMLVSCFFTV